MFERMQAIFERTLHQSVSRMTRGLMQSKVAKEPYDATMPNLITPLVQFELSLRFFRVSLLFQDVSLAWSDNGGMAEVPAAAANYAG